MRVKPSGYSGRLPLCPQLLYLGANAIAAQSRRNTAIGIKSLARSLHVSEATAKRVMHELEQHGVLSSPQTRNGRRTLLMDAAGQRALWKRLFGKEITVGPTDGAGPARTTFLPPGDPSTHSRRAQLLRSEVEYLRHRDGFSTHVQMLEDIAEDEEFLEQLRSLLE